MFPPEASDIAFEEPKAADHSCHQPEPCNYAEVRINVSLLHMFLILCSCAALMISGLFGGLKAALRNAEKGHMHCYGLQ
jgi:hypothetical protein